MQARTRELLEQLQSHIDPTAPVGSLSPAQQQIVEIAKAMSYDLRVLILDEPSAALMFPDVGRATVTVLERLVVVVPPLTRGSTHGRP